MIFTRILSVLIATAACAQALHVPNARDVDVTGNTQVGANKLSERDINAVRDLGASGFATLQLRSDDIPSFIAVGNPPGVAPGPYQCNNRADCQQKIDYARAQVAEAKTFVTKWNNALKAAGKDEAKIREAKNNLDTAKGSLEHWQEEIDDYTRLQATFHN